MRRRLIVMFAVAVAAVTILAGCGEKKKEDPLSQITATETFPETEESTAAVTAADEETTAEFPPEPPADAEETVFYHYEVFTDGQPHKVIYWTDGETQKSMMFTSLSLPEWGIKSISLPSEFVESEGGKEIQELKGDEGAAGYMKLAEEKALVDDSYDYPGAWSRRDEYSLFRVWRAEIDETFDFENAYPEEIYHAVYPFVDKGAFAINRDRITKYKNSDGTIEYLLDCKNMGHWGNIKKTADGGYEAPVTKMYGGYILVRPKGNVAHCIFYASTGDECYGESEYVLIESAEYTDVQDITEGAICKK